MMNKNRIYEMPFEYLRRKEDGNKFSDEIVRNWYIARAFVLNQFKEMKVGFEPESNAHLHVIVDGDSPVMLSIVRQLALSAHFINFQEGSETEEALNRTIITLVSKNPNIIKELEKEEYLCHLPLFCKVVNRGQTTENKGYYIDVEIHIVDNLPISDKNNTVLFTENDVAHFCKQKEREEIFNIDTQKAVYATRIYDLGLELNNIPAEDIHSAKRYSLALDVFQHIKLKETVGKMIDEATWERLSLSEIKENISNIMCSDCFSLREECIKRCAKDNALKTMELWEKYNEVLSKSEHARWVVEKLIMGYRPLNQEERYHDETLHVQFKNKEKRKKYRDSLKKTDNDPAHIDICSYRDLRRINPDDLKFDSFLMLAIPKILEKVKESD